MCLGEVAADRMAPPILAAAKKAGGRTTQFT